MTAIAIPARQRHVLAFGKPLGLTDEQIVIERDTVNRLVTITVEYDREIQLKPFPGKTKIIHFVEQKSGPLIP